MSMGYTSWTKRILKAMATGEMTNLRGWKCRWKPALLTVGKLRGVAVSGAGRLRAAHYMLLLLGAADPQGIAGPPRFHSGPSPLFPQVLSPLAHSGKQPILERITPAQDSKHAADKQEPPIRHCMEPGQRGRSGVQLLRDIPLDQGNRSHAACSV